MNWEKVGSEFLYILFIVDVGCFLKLICVVGNEFRVSELILDVISFVIVVVGFGYCFFDVRYMYIKKLIVDNYIFRVVLYNILVDTYFKDEFV